MQDEEHLHCHGQTTLAANIRVTATYSDSSGPEESVSLTSETSVQAFHPGKRRTPRSASTTVTRRIAENSTGNIGGPVAATDADGDTLTYAISGGTDVCIRLQDRSGHRPVDGRSLV